LSNRQLLRFSLNELIIIAWNFSRRHSIGLISTLWWRIKQTIHISVKTMIFNICVVDLNTLVLLPFFVFCAKVVKDYQEIVFEFATLELTSLLWSIETFISSTLFYLIKIWFLPWDRLLWLIWIVSSHLASSKKFNSFYY